MKKKIRFASFWKNDADYLSKLTPDEKAYYAKFTSEYYACENLDEESLHGPEHKKSIHDSQNASWADIVTQSGDRVTQSASKRVKPGHAHRYYGPQDYRCDQSSSSIEDKLIECIDASSKPVE
jgi:hypothetical protein